MKCLQSCRLHSWWVGDVVVEVHREDGHFCVQHTDGIEGVHAHFFDDGTFEKLLTNAHSHQG